MLLVHCSLLLPFIKLTCSNQYAFNFSAVFEFDSNAVNTRVKPPNIIICLMSVYSVWNRGEWLLLLEFNNSCFQTMIVDCRGQIFAQPITYKARICQTTSKSRIRVEPQAAQVDLVGQHEIRNTCKVEQWYDSLQLI